MANYRRLTQLGYGHWFGAYIKDQLVGDLGLFFENGVARFQHIGTHPNFRRQGVCSSLVYLVSQMALKEFNVQTLVMEADDDYFAADIYESIGFQPSERNHSLSWWKNKTL